MVPNTIFVLIRILTFIYGISPEIIVFIVFPTRRPLWIRQFDPWSLFYTIANLRSNVWLKQNMFLFCFTKILNQAFYMTHTFDSEVSFWMLWPTVRRRRQRRGGGLHVHQCSLNQRPRKIIHRWVLRTEPAEPEGARGAFAHPRFWQIFFQSS